MQGRDGCSITAITLPRPENTGRALFRYVAHADLDLYQNKVVLYGDLNFFTDRERHNKVAPTELDWIVGLALRWNDMEFSVYREQAQPVDRPGLVQQYVAVQLRLARPDHKPSSAALQLELSPPLHRMAPLMWDSLSWD
jgi:hypothetical protein